MARSYTDFLYPESPILNGQESHKTIYGPGKNDKQEIYYQEYGKRDGELVFVLHGGPGYGTSDFYHQYFDPNFYHIVIFDQRNAKRSRPAAGTHPDVLKHCTSEQMMEDIDRLAVEFGVDFTGKDKTKPQKKIHLMGGSWGSALGLYYAVHHPDHLHSLTIRATTFAIADDLNKLHAVDKDGITPLLKLEMEKNGQDWEKMRPTWEAYVGLVKDKASQFGTEYIKAYQYLLTDPNVDVATRKEAALRWTMIEHLAGDVEPGHDAAWVRNDVLTSMTEDELVSYAAINNHWIVSLLEGREGFYGKQGEPRFNYFANPAQIKGQQRDPLEQIAKVPLIRVVHGVKDVVCFMKETDWLEENLQKHIRTRLKKEGKLRDSAAVEDGVKKALRVERPAESGHMISDPGISEALRNFSDEIRDLHQQDKGRGGRDGP